MIRLAPVSMLLCLSLLCPAGIAHAQVDPAPDATTTIRATTTLVLVPTLVTVKHGEPVFTLTAPDFVITDDGSPQILRLEEDSDRQPIALVIAVEAGGDGAGHLGDYERLGPMIEALVGNVEHTIAVVGFDSQAALVQPFTESFTVADEAVRGIGPGDGKAAILDGLQLSVDLLRKQPPRYRRAVLLFSETLDHGSHIRLNDSLRAVSDTNTAIYSFAFSSTKAAAKDEAARFNSKDAGPDHGCMGRDSDEERAEKGTKDQSRGAQAFDCLSQLAPPLRLAKIAATAAIDSLRKNVPETVANLTGGEYFSFNNEKSLEKGLQTLTNHVPNRYVLSFHPLNPHPGLHSVVLSLPDRPGLHVAARTSYWAEGPVTP